MTLLFSLCWPDNILAVHLGYDIHADIKWHKSPQGLKRAGYSHMPTEKPLLGQRHSFKHACTWPSARVHSMFMLKGRHKSKLQEWNSQQRYQVMFNPKINCVFCILLWNLNCWISLVPKKIFFTKQNKRFRIISLDLGRNISKTFVRITLKYTK